MKPDAPDLDARLTWERNKYMANDRRGAARGADIQGPFVGGRPRLPGVTSPPSPTQPRRAGAQPIQPRMARPDAARLSLSQPVHVPSRVNHGTNGCMPARAVPTPNAQSRGANSPINQHSAHLQRIVQAKMAQPRAVQHQAAQPRRAAPQGPVVQRHINARASSPVRTVVQMECELCGKDKGHYSHCPRHKHNRNNTKEVKEKKQEKQQNASYLNLKSYRPNWVKNNNITEKHVKAYYGKIRGHHSGDCDKNDGEQGITTQDLNDFKKWFTKEYEYWY